MMQPFALRSGMGAKGCMWHVAITTHNSQLVETGISSDKFLFVEQWYPEKCFSSGIQVGRRGSGKSG